MTIATDHRLGGRRALTLAAMAAIIEGFDLQSAGVAAPQLVLALRLTPQQVGLFFSAATFGLIIGALIGGRIADAWAAGPGWCWRWSRSGLSHWRQHLSTALNN